MKRKNSIPLKKIIKKKLKSTKKLGVECSEFLIIKPWFAQVTWQMMSYDIIIAGQQ